MIGSILVFGCTGGSSAARRLSLRVLGQGHLGILDPGLRILDCGITQITGGRPEIGKDQTNDYILSVKAFTKDSRKSRIMCIAGSPQLHAGIQKKRTQSKGSI